MPDEYFDKAIHADPHQSGNAYKGDLAAMLTAYPAEMLNQPALQETPATPPTTAEAPPTQAPPTAD